MQAACRVLCSPPPTTAPQLRIPCLCSQLFRSSSWVFDLFYLVPNLSCCTHGQLFLVPYSFFVFSCSGDVCPGVSPAAKGPRFQPVSPGPSPTLWNYLHILEGDPQGLVPFPSASFSLGPLPPSLHSILPLRSGPFPGEVLVPQP